MAVGVGASGKCLVCATIVQDRVVWRGPGRAASGPLPRAGARVGYKEPLASRVTQRGEVIYWPATPRRADAPARATALSDWLVCLGLPRPCEGEAAVTRAR